MLELENKMREVVTKYWEESTDREVTQTQKLDKFYKEYWVFLKRFEDIELINSKGPLASKVKSIDLKLEASEHARKMMEK